MTRAKTKLIMSYVKTRLHHETDPSRFLDEIFPESAKDRHNSSRRTVESVKSQK